MKQFCKQLPEFTSSLNIVDYLSLLKQIKPVWETLGGVRDDLENVISRLSSTRTSLPEFKLGSETLNALSVFNDKASSKQIPTLSFENQTLCVAQSLFMKSSALGGNHFP
jgi:hypothetical protein